MNTISTCTEDIVLQYSVMNGNPCRSKHLKEKCARLCTDLETQLRVPKTCLRSQCSDIGSDCDKVSYDECLLHFGWRLVCGYTCSRFGDN